MTLRAGWPECPRCGRKLLRTDRARQEGECLIHGTLILIPEDKKLGTNAVRDPRLPGEGGEPA